MERQPDIYSGIADKSNSIHYISKYLEISEIIPLYQKLFRYIWNWNSEIKYWIRDIIKSFRNIINWMFDIIHEITDIIDWKKILVTWKIIVWYIANSNF